MKKGENIFKRKDGRWEARYIKGYELSGKIKYGFCYGKTYQEAKEKVAKFKAAIVSGKPLPPSNSRRRFAFYCDAWLQKRKTNIRESTYTKYDTILEKHIKPKLGGCYPLGITTGVVDSFTKELLDGDGLSVKTVHDILTVLHGILKYILMCVAMLIGTTFAWFTDTASTAVNKIQSGKLDVALEMSNDGTTWETAEGKTLTFKTTDNRAADQILWEPGCTYELPKLRVVNNGNLALKYKIKITGIQGDAKLNEVIDWTINDAAINLTEEHLSAGQTGTAFTIKGHMQETAGNEYQNLTIDGIGITVVATQLASEYDSINNTYDENADYTIHVNKDNIQDYLDGKYGSINGMTLVLAAGNYDKLELGRATKYSGSNTDYYIGGVSEANKKTYDDFVAIKNSGQWSASAYYVRNMSNVTIKAAEGASVTVAGIAGGSGHVYGECYDYVLDKAYTVGSAYYLTQNWNNITFEGLTFTAPADINSSLETTLIDGVTFKNCTFNIGSTASGNQALRYYNENNNGKVKNLTVDGCSFNTCYQGVYTQKINGVTVINSSFDTTAHNAIAVQSGAGPVNHKAVVITGNTFANIGDRIIRFGDVGPDTQITIKDNIATNSGDSSGQVMKAQSLAEGVTYDISGNNWGDGKTVANTELTDRQ